MSRQILYRKRLVVLQKIMGTCRISFSSTFVKTDKNVHIVFSNKCTKFSVYIKQIFHAQHKVTFIEII